jgi:tetratricopeptide (TPR) repeat protein
MGGFMNKLSRAVFAPVVLFCLVLSFGGCGKGNLFSWAHNSGSGTTTASLSSDAYTALQNKDYSKALSYYTKILANDPNNSEAIYGYSVANLGEQGLDIATLITNLVNQSQSNSSSSKLAPAVASLGSAALATNLLPSTIIAHAAAIKAAIDRILDPSKLPKITKGLADGKIKPDDADVNINIAFCLVLRSALRLNDIVVFDTDYNATIKAGVSTAELNAAALDSAKDIASAYYHIKIVADKISAADPSKKSTLSDLNANVKQLFDQFKVEVKKNPYNIDLSGVVLGTDYL